MEIPTHTDLPLLPLDGILIRETQLRSRSLIKPTDVNEAFLRQR